jgi:hypothetical protein
LGCILTQWTRTISVFAPSLIPSPSSLHLFHQQLGFIRTVALSSPSGHPFTARKGDVAGTILRIELFVWEKSALSLHPVRQPYLLSFCGKRSKRLEDEI